MTPVEQQRQLQLIWAAMLGAVALYGVVCAVAVGAPDGEPAAEAAGVRYGFSVVAIVLGGLSAWCRRRFLAADATLGLARIQVQAVVVWALSEAVGLCGVATAVLTREAREFPPFGAAATALLFLHRPSNLPRADAPPQ